ncbi:hypothetical protein D3C86_2053440 [compost metagenome]
MLRRPLEAEAACHRLADREMRLEPDPHRDVELVMARLRNGFVQGKVFLRTKIVALQTLFQRRNGLLDAGFIGGLPVARRKFGR